ncbi:MAG TPA: periplasmic heavy metal sensor [Anaeromyxobacter sp.]|nr:periplasmic heavy metal sensor [Anaeromyxobacter sp.]
MTAFLSGALGALAVLLLAAALRRAAWRRMRRHGPARLGFLLRRIAARPDQARAVRAEADALSEAFLALRGDAGALRGELADLLAAPELDVARVSAALDARLARMDALRARFAEALARVHAVLDPPQREALAAMVRRGPHRHGCRRARGAHA